MSTLAATVPKGLLSLPDTEEVIVIWYWPDKCFPVSKFPLQENDDGVLEPEAQLEPGEGEFLAWFSGDDHERAMERAITIARDHFGEMVRQKSFDQGVRFFCPTDSEVFLDDATHITEVAYQYEQIVLRKMEVVEVRRRLRSS